MRQAGNDLILAVANFYAMSSRAKMVDIFSLAIAMDHWRAQVIQGYTHVFLPCTRAWRYVLRSDTRYWDPMTLLAPNTSWHLYGTLVIIDDRSSLAVPSVSVRSCNTYYTVRLAKGFLTLIRP